MNYYLLALLAVSALDVAVTYRNLKAGGRELNPLPAKLIAKIGLWPTLLGTKVVIVGVGLYANHPAYYTVASILTAVAVVYSLMAGRK